MLSASTIDFRDCIFFAQRGSEERGGRGDEAAGESHQRCLRQADQHRRKVN